MVTQTRHASRSAVTRVTHFPDTGKFTLPLVGGKRDACDTFSRYINKSWGVTRDAFSPVIAHTRAQGLMGKTRHMRHTRHGSGSR
jgi:hypothetical protein